MPRESPLEYGVLLVPSSQQKATIGVVQQSHFVNPGAGWIKPGSASNWMVRALSVLYGAPDRNSSVRVRVPCVLCHIGVQR